MLCGPKLQINVVRFHLSAPKELFVRTSGFGSVWPPLEDGWKEGRGPAMKEKDQIISYWPKHNAMERGACLQPPSFLSSLYFIYYYYYN